MQKQFVLTCPDCKAEFEQMYVYFDEDGVVIVGNQCGNCKVPVVCKISWEEAMSSFKQHKGGYDAPDKLQ